MMGICMDLLARNFRNMALMTLMAFDCYLRPGEALDVKGSSVVAPVRAAGQQYRWVTLVIREFEGHRPDKTGVFDNSIPIDKVDLQWLGQELLHRKKMLNTPSDPMFSFTMEEFRKQFQRSATRIGLDGLRPYQLRHGIQCSQKPWKVEDRLISPEIRQDRKGATVAQQDVSISDSVLQVGRQESGEVFQRNCSAKERMMSKVDVFAISNRPHKFSLEIFAGTARVSQAVSSEEHVMFPIDICLFSSHNVLCPRIEQKNLTWIRTGRIRLTWLGMPCTTFSRARKNDGLGPGPLRSSDFIWGLPCLSTKDQQKVSEGNALFFFTLRVLQTCIQYNVPFVLENPLSSMAWELPPLVELVHSANCLFCDLDYCQYGESWKKPTRLMYNFLDISSLSKRCCGSYNQCSSTNQPHVRLLGIGPNNVFMTLLAQPYPWQLCHDFAQVARALRG